ncbi:MAG: apolipoprotein N-acyltransferase [Actinomycetes bacterium]
MRGRGLSLPWRCAVAAVAGAALVLAFPPFDLWWLAPLPVAAFTLACRGETAVRGASVGLVFGMVFFAGLMPWLRVIGPDAWVLLSATCAVFLAALGAATSLATRVPGWPLWVACLWVAEEALRDRWPLGGFPWGRLAFSQPHSAVTAWAALGGAPLVTFTVALAGTCVAFAVISTTTRGRVVVLGAAVAVVGVGLVIPTPTDGRTITAAVVQGNVPRTGMDAFGQRVAVLSAHVEATRTLAKDVRAGTMPKPDFVVWPENASDIDPVLDKGAYTLIDDVVSEIGVPVLVGMVVQTPDGTKLRNEGVVWDPVTGPGQVYVKRHPVPFGEYVPFRSLLQHFISRFDRVPKDFAAGTDPGVLTLGTTTVANVICFEVAYDQIVRDAVVGGGEVITVQTNNATYGRTGQVEQQLAISQLRAVEHGRSVLVAATSGISAVISPDGTILDSVPEFTQSVMVQDVPARTQITLADRMRGWPELVLAMVGLGAAVAGFRRRSSEDVSCPNP